MDYGKNDNGDREREDIIADKVLAFMARGLHSNWKQPIGYFFVGKGFKSGKLRELVDKSIEFMEKCNAIVLGLVCDQGATNCGVFKSYNISVEKPYFDYGTDGRKIYCMHDMPHLIKSLRNNFLNYRATFETSGILEHASWNDFLRFVMIDSQKSIRMAPKISERHIHFKDSFQKMRVNLAAQVFSHTVASGMSAIAESPGTSGSDNMDLVGMASTARFFKKIDGIFDCSNSSRKKTTKALRKPLKKNSPHEKFLEEALSWMKNVKFIDNDKEVKTIRCVNGLCMWLSGVLQMVKYLRQNYSLDVIQLSHISQDPLENWFSAIRGNLGGYNRNPDVTQFSSVARILFVKALIRPSPGANCEPDEVPNSNPFLASLNDFCQKKKALPKRLHPLSLLSQGSSPNLEKIDLSFVEDVKSQSMEYYAGFIVKKVIAKHNCEDCREAMVSNERSDSSFLEKKRYDESSSMVTPSENAVKFVTMVIEQVEQNLPKVKFSDDIIQSLKDLSWDNIKDFNFVKCNNVLECIFRYISHIHVHTLMKRENDKLKKKNRKNFF